MVLPPKFTPLLPCESGIAPGTVLGRISKDQGGSSFFYSKTILRSIGSGVSTVRGSWDFQIVDPSGEEVLFDSSVDIGIQLVGAEDPLFGSISLFSWSFVSDYGLGPGKPRTRVVSGVPVPQVVEAYTGAADATPPVGSPAMPGYPYLRTLKQTSIVAVMPPKPAGANSLTLLVAASQNGPYTTLRTGLQTGAQVTVNVADVPGVSNPANIWFRVGAVNGFGTTYGPRVRDAFMALDGTTQLSGYTGWQHIGGEVTHPTVFSEQAREWEPGGGGEITVGGGTIIATWTSPVYRCSFPPGAVLVVNHDNWAPAIVIRDRFTFAVSYLPAKVTEASAQDARLGKTWVLYPGGTQTKIAQTRRRESYVVNDHDPVVFDTVPSSLGLFRVGGRLLAVAQKGADIVGAESVDDGLTWAAAHSEGLDVIVADTTILASCVNDSAIYAVAKATADEVDDSKPADQLIKQDDMIRVVLSPSKQASGAAVYAVTHREKLQGTAPPASGALILNFAAGAFNFLVKDGDTVRLFTSSDDCLTFTEVPNAN